MLWVTKLQLLRTSDVGKSKLPLMLLSFYKYANVLDIPAEDSALYEYRILNLFKSS
jgi:hypothetical protein